MLYIAYYTNNINCNLPIETLLKTLILNSIIIYIIVGYSMKNDIKNAYIILYYSIERVLQFFFFF